MPENEENITPQDVEGTAGEGQQTAPADNVSPGDGEGSVPKGRDAVVGRLRERYPDGDFSEGDGIWDHIGRYMDEDAESISRSRESAKRLMDVIDSDQLAGDLFVAMAHGENPIVHLVRKWGPDITEWLQTDEGAEAFRKAAQEYRAKQEQKGKDEEQWTANVNASIERLRAFGEAHGLDEEKQTELFDRLLALGQSFIDGNYTDGDFSLALNAINHDGDVASAREEGEIEGRNTKIRERIRKGEPERTMPTPMQGGGEAPDSGDGEREERLSYEERLHRDPLGLSRFREK